MIPQRLLQVERASFTVVLLLLCLLRSAHAYCRQGSEWIEFDGNCYRWSRSEGNWFNAELTCQKFGGHLVSISSVNENNFLLRLTQCSGNYWIGMANTNNSLKGEVRGYEWWDGTPHNFTALSLRTLDYYDCVYSDRYGKWLNLYCQSGFGSVCMAPADGQQQGTERSPRAEAVWYTHPWTTSRDSTTSDWTSITPEEWTTSDWTSITPEEWKTSDWSSRRPEEWTTSDWTSIRPDEWRTTTKADVSTRVWPTAQPTTASPNECPHGWQLMDSSCYFVSDNKTNYFNAQMSCQAMGASVSSVLTPREHTLLTVALGCNSPTWIGLEKARPCFRQPGRDHCWVWMDRSPLVFTEWAPGQNLDRRDAECVVLDGQWKVQNCYAEFSYICKRPAYGLKSGSD